LNQYGALIALFSDIIVAITNQLILLIFHTAMKRFLVLVLIDYGTDMNKLYHHYMVYDNTELKINSLNATAEYFFLITAFNENGISNSQNQKVVSIN